MKATELTEQHLGTFNDNSLQFTPLASGTCYGCSTDNIQCSRAAMYRCTLKNVQTYIRQANGYAYAQRPLTFHKMYRTYHTYTACVRTSTCPHPSTPHAQWHSPGSVRCVIPHICKCFKDIVVKLHSCTEMNST